MGRNHSRFRVLVLLICCAVLAAGAIYWPALAAEVGEDPESPAESGETQEAPAETSLEDMSLEELREYIKQNTVRQEQLEDQKAALEGEIDNAEAEIGLLESQMSLIQEQITMIEQGIQTAQATIDDLELQIAETEEDLAERQDLLQQRMVNLYVYGDVTLLDVVFGTDSFEDFLSVYDLTQRIMGQDEVLLQQINTDLTNIQYYKSQAEETLAEQESLKHDLQDQQTDLNLAIGQYEAKLSELGTSFDRLESLWQQEVAAGEAANAFLRDMISDATLSFGGSFIWPLPAAWQYVSSEYGWRTHPIYGDSRFHSGIDIPADGGTNIFAVAEGKVIYAAELGGYGNCVMIDHGDQVVSLYGHLSAYGGYGVGDYVVAGDVIGYVGTTGASTGNHLHFEVRLNGSSTSPWEYIR